MLVAVLDALSLGQVDVVGVDTGGALTQLLMTDHRVGTAAALLPALSAARRDPLRELRVP